VKILIIHPLEIIETEHGVKVQSLIEYSGEKRVLWYLIPHEYGKYVTEKLDGFLVGLLPLAMQLGEDVTVKGRISEKLHFNLCYGYMNLIKLVVPYLKPVKIEADSFDSDKAAKCEGAIVTGFSAGVDSFCAVHDHYFNPELPSDRITHFIFNNVGSHGELDHEKARKVFNFRYDLIKGYPESLGVDFIKVDSNLSEVLPPNFEVTHVCRNASVVLLLQKLFSRYYYASSCQYKDCVAKPSDDMSVVDPLCVHLFSTETLDCVSSGCKYSRVEKTRIVAQVQDANLWLNICAKSVDGKNCSVCWKCGRTLLTLEMLGLLDKFDGVFDLEKWRKARRRYLVKYLSDDDELFREIRDYAKSSGFSFGFFNLFLSKLFRFYLMLTK
jgi:hypothetical protein